MSEFDEEVAKLESQLNLSHGFFVELSKEDDWSFVIKCHALMETACSYLLTEYFNKPEYASIFLRLEMSDKRRGKLAFLRAAGLVIKEEARFIIGLSELRNSLVHDIHNIRFQFSEYITSLDKQQRQVFVKNFGYPYLDSGKNGNSIIIDGNQILLKPKSTILRGLKTLLTIINMQVDIKQSRLKTEDLKKEIYKMTIEYNRLQRKFETT